MTNRNILRLVREFKTRSLSIWEKIYINEHLDPVFSLYYKIISLFKRIKKTIQFIPHVWAHEDWDYGYIIKFNLYLHKRLYKGLYEEGHHVANPKHVRSLKTIIELLKRLDADNYREEEYKYIENKYGEIEYSFEKIVKDGKTFTTLVDKRSLKLDPDVSKAYERAKSDAFKKEAYLQKQDMLLLTKLINKHYKMFWD